MFSRALTGGAGERRTAGRPGLQIPVGPKPSIRRPPIEAHGKADSYQGGDRLPEVLELPNSTARSSDLASMQQSRTAITPATNVITIFRAFA